MKSTEERQVKQLVRRTSLPAKAAIVAGTLVLLVLAVSGITGIGGQNSRRHTQRRRSLEEHYYGHASDNDEIVEVTMEEAYMYMFAPQVPWGPVWHVEDMLANIEAEAPSTLAKKFRDRLNGAIRRGNERPHKRGALPRILFKNSGNYTGSIPDKMVVVARADEDVSWLSLYLPDVPHTVYQAGWTPASQFLAGTGPMPAFTAQPQAKETNVYLQYIVSHYDRLPDSIVFIHAHRQGWHMNDAVSVLRRLRWGEVGYANLRHQGFGDWMCGAPGEANFPCGWEGSVLTPRDPFSNVFNAQPQAGAAARVGGNLGKYWSKFFEEELGPLPELVYTQCCAEFMVSRDRILRHPREFYKRLLDEVNSYDSSELYHELALAFEYAWHMIFGEPPVYSGLPECELLRCEPARASAGAGGGRKAGKSV